MEIFLIIMTHILMFNLGWKLSYDINFKHSENTVSVSNDSDESSVLHGVGESHASEPTDKDNQSFDDGTLERITGAKELIKCPKCQYPVFQEELDLFDGLCVKCGFKK